MTVRGGPCARTFEACARLLEGVIVQATPKKQNCGEMTGEKHGEKPKNPPSRWHERQKLVCDITNDKLYRSKALKA